MKQLTKATKDYSKNAKIVAAVEKILNDLNNASTEMASDSAHYRFATRWNGTARDLRADEYGRLDLIDCLDGTSYKMPLYEQSGDIFAVPGFATTGDGDGWTGTSLNGQSYTINADDMPVVED